MKESYLRISTILIIISLMIAKIFAQESSKVNPDLLSKAWSETGLLLRQCL